ncbi:MAG: guanylate kinase [Bacilli bacterium]|jgi:guanylate kinase
MIILVGASASGKTEVAKRLGLLFGMKKVITHTTREPRVGEKDGVDYYFVTVEEFQRLKDEGQFVETTFYNGNYYGTSKKEISDNKVLIVDPEGLKHFKSLNDKRIVAFFIDVSRRTRRKRMLGRGDSVETANSRIANDDEKFNLRNISDYDFIINNETLTIDEVACYIFERYAQTISLL